MNFLFTNINDYWKTFILWWFLDIVLNLITHWITILKFVYYRYFNCLHEGDLQISAFQ